MSVATLIDAILLSPPYLCLALAFGLLYGMLGTMDLTVSSRFTAGAYGGWCATHLLGWYAPLDPAVWLGAALAAIVVSLAAFVLLRPLGNASPLVALIGSVGLSQVMEAALLAAFGARPKVFVTYPVESGIAFLGTSATPLQLFALGYAVVAIGLIAILMRIGTWGQRLQIVAGDPELAAAVLGISNWRVQMTANVVVAAILAPAAVMHAASRGVQPTSGGEIAMLAFVAAVVAGRGHALGGVIVVAGLVIFRSLAIRLPWPEVAAAIGGLLLSIAQLSCRKSQTRLRDVLVGLITLVFATALVWIGRQALPGVLPQASIPSAFQYIVPYVLVVGLLLIRPQGLLAFSKTRTV